MTEQFMPKKNTQTGQFVVKLHNSNRHYDSNGNLHVDNCVLTASEVSDYIGSSIGGYHELGLEPNEVYGIYRPLEELQKSLDLYKNLTLVDGHVEVTPSSPKRERWIGNIGSEPYIEGNELKNSLMVGVGKAIDEIEGKNGKPKRDLSVGYSYTLVPEEGEFEGKPYKFKMVDIKPNHVALVYEGRVGVAKIADSVDLDKRGIKVKFSMLKLFKCFARDGKDIKANDSLREMAKCVIVMANDEEYLGKEDKLVDDMSELLAQMQKMHKKEEADDEEEEEEEEEKKKKREAEDDEEEEEAESETKKKVEKKVEKKEAEDDEEEEATNANDEVDHFAQALLLSQKVIGRVSNDLISKADANIIVDKTLLSQGVALDGMSSKEKFTMLKILANQKRVGKSIANDQNIKKTTINLQPMFNPLKRKV